MEGPIDFDIWVNVKAEERKSAIDWLVSNREYSRLDAVKRISNALTNNDYVELYRECGWENVADLTESLPIFASSYAVSESTYKPSDKLDFCEEHQLYYARNEGCPVCDDFFIRVVKDGVKMLQAGRECWVVPDKQIAGRVSISSSKYEPNSNLVPLEDFGNHLSGNDVSSVAYSQMKRLAEKDGNINLNFNLNYN